MRDAVGCGDMSALSKFEISGGDAAAFMAVLGANAPPRGIGRMSLVHSLNHPGGVESEFTVARLGEIGSISPAPRWRAAAITICCSSRRAPFLELRSKT